MGCMCRVTPLRFFIQGLSQVHRLENSSFRRLTSPTASLAYSRQLVVARQSRLLHVSRIFNQDATATETPSKAPSAESDPTSSATAEQSPVEENHQESEAVTNPAVVAPPIEAPESVTASSAATELPPVKENHQEAEAVANPVEVAPPIEATEPVTASSVATEQPPVEETHQEAKAVSTIEKPVEGVQPVEATEPATASSAATESLAAKENQQETEVVSAVAKSVEAGQLIEATHYGTLVSPDQIEKSNEGSAATETSSPGPKKISDKYLKKPKWTAAKRAEVRRALRAAQKAEEPAKKPRWTEEQKAEHKEKQKAQRAQGIKPKGSVEKFDKRAKKPRWTDEEKARGSRPKEDRPVVEKRVKKPRRDAEEKAEGKSPRNNDQSADKPAKKQRWTSEESEDSRPWKSYDGSQPTDRAKPPPKASRDPMIEKPAQEKPAWKVQKEALKEKFPEGWMPRKRLSPDALAGIRALNAQFPEHYTTSTLAQKFEVSPENIRRILKSSWKPTADEEKSRQERWFSRGMRVWDHQAALGMKPPRKWRLEGITRDPSYHKQRRAAIKWNRKMNEHDDREVRANMRKTYAQDAASERGPRKPPPSGPRTPPSSGPRTSPSSGPSRGKFTFN